MTGGSAERASGAGEPGASPVFAANQVPQGEVRRGLVRSRKVGEARFGRQDADCREPDFGAQTALHHNRNRDHPIHRRIQRKEVRPDSRPMARRAHHVHALHRQSRPGGTRRSDPSPRSPRGCPWTTSGSVIRYSRQPESNRPRVRRQRSCFVAEIYRRHCRGILTDRHRYTRGDSGQPVVALSRAVGCSDSRDAAPYAGEMPSV